MSWPAAAGRVDHASADLVGAGAQLGEPGGTDERQSQRTVGLFRVHWVAGAIFIVALAARLGVILRRGGIRGIIGYDCGVYFAGADALIHGRMPYRDFTMVHPPGITLILTPFAALTHWMSDWHAFLIATLAFCVLGALNAVLVVRVCRRFGFTAWASGLAGLFYALWYGAISGEFEIKLSPLENLFLLLGLLLVLRAQRKTSGRIWLVDLAAGAVLGLSTTTKIWWVVPVLLLVLWHAWTQASVRAGLRVTLGAALSIFVVCAPFFFTDPSGMFASVITEQLGRATRVSAVSRIDSLTTLPDLRMHFSQLTVAGIGIVFVLLAVGVLLLAWRASKATRVMVALVVVQLVVLFEAPSWFPYYADYLAVGLAVCVGAAACTLAGHRAPKLAIVPAIVLTSGAVVITAVVTITGSMAVRPFPGAAQLTRAVRNVQCMTATTDAVLIRLDALTRGLDAGCPNWIDVSGHRYALPGENRAQSRTAWDRELTDYLRSGDAVSLSVTPVSKGVARAVERDGVVARAGGNVIYWGRKDAPLQLSALRVGASVAADGASGALSPPGREELRPGAGTYVAQSARHAQAAHTRFSVKVGVRAVDLSSARDNDDRFG